MFEILLNILLNGLVVFGAFKKRALTFSGSLTAFMVGGILYYFGGFLSWLLLILFFLSSSVINTLKKRRAVKPHSSVNEEEKAGRSGRQVLANSLPALGCLLLYVFSSDPVYYFSMVACIAGATADTWGSEIGILSKKRPFSITTLKPMEAGLSGGISQLGLVASLGGAAFISLILFFSSHYTPVEGELTVGVLSLLILMGFFSSIIDSILGATIQEKFIGENYSLTEIKPASGESGTLSSGVLGVDNNRVNFLSGVLTAVFSITLFVII